LAEYFEISVLMLMKPIMMRPNMLSPRSMLKLALLSFLCFSIGHVRGDDMGYMGGNNGVSTPVVNNSVASLPLVAPQYRYSPYEMVADVESTWYLKTQSTIKFVIPTITSYRKQFFISANIIVHKPPVKCVGTCSLGFYFSAEGYNISETTSGLLSKQYIAPSAVCHVRFNVTENTTVSCFDFIRIPGEVMSFVNQSRQGNLTVVGHVVSRGEQPFDLSSVRVSVHINVQAVPYVFEKWRWSGVDVSQIDCFWNEFVLAEKRMGADTDAVLKFGKLMIINNGRNVTIEYGADKKMIASSKSSMGYRMRSMQLGIQEAMQFLLKKFRLRTIPNITALLYVGDEAFFAIPPEYQGWCDPGPIMAQNRLFNPANSFVVVPDFSYFTHFWDNHDHGMAADRWFEIMQLEKIATERKLFSRLIYGKNRFDDKAPAAVFRGRVSGRRMGPLRGAIVQCKLTDRRLNASASQYMSRMDMCSNFQAVISVPGNGVWSWATKYNLVRRLFFTKYSLS
jgi:hypothetical protein